MKFRYIDVEVSGIKEVIIDGDLYRRVEHKQTTAGGKTVTNKYFRREKDGHMIHEHNFMSKLKRLQVERQEQRHEYTFVDTFGDVKTERECSYINKWRFWISGDSINIERILV